jgi:DNA-binding transcriptional LysR family regulator
MVDRAFRRAGLEPVPFLVLDTRDGVYEAVANGLGTGFMWRYGTGRADAVRRLRLAEGTRHDEVAFALAAESGPLIEEFLATARDLAQAFDGAPARCGGR